MAPLTRLRAKTAASSAHAMPKATNGNSSSPEDTGDIEEIALLLEDCGFEDCLRAAFSERNRREDDDEGDTEPGQELRYPSLPGSSQPPTSLSSAAPASDTPPPSPSLTQVRQTPAVKPVGGLSDSQPPETSRDRRRKEGKAKRRARAKSKNTPSNHKIRSSFSKKYAQSGRKIPLQQFTMQTLRTIARGAYIARRMASGKGLTTLQQALMQGLRLIRWDGQKPTLLVDKVRFLCAVLGGFPGMPLDWKLVHDEASEAMSAAAASLQFGKLSDRRGTYRTIACGTSYGGGQRRPGFLHHTAHNQAILRKLMSNKAIVRIASSQSSMFAFYAPKLYRDYATQLDRLFQRYPDLTYNWQSSVFPAVSFNFGPQAVCYEHNDHGNRPVGWCAITAGGDFDPRHGGHLILREFGVIVEFPPGSTILIPSASITHGNVPVRSSETRWSITQYAAGGLFRYVDYGFQSWKSLQDSDRKRAKELLEARDSRWVQELQLLSKVDELHEDREIAGLVG